MAGRPRGRPAPLLFVSDAGLSRRSETLLALAPAWLEVWLERADLTRAPRPPRLLPQPITLIRDPDCICAGEAYFRQIKADRATPHIPRHPVVRSDKPELRQQLTDPKRRICLGSFFSPGLAASGASDPQACSLQPPVLTPSSRNSPSRRTSIAPDRPRSCAWPPRPRRRGSPKFGPKFHPPEQRL